MEQNNNYKSRISPSVYLLIFIIAIIFEFYWIMTDPYDYFMLIGIGIIALIMGYLTFESIIMNYNRIQKERFDQNEMIIKTQKALYLATKKSTQANELRAAQSIEAIKYMVNKMTDNQKELTNMFLTASEEKAALTSSSATNTNGGEDIASLVAKLSESNNKLAKEVQAAVTVSELVKSNELLVNSVRDILENREQPVVTESIIDNTLDPQPVVMESILDDTLDLEMNVDSENMPNEMPDNIEDLVLPSLDNIADYVNDEVIDDFTDEIADDFTNETVDDTPIAEDEPLSKEESSNPSGMLSQEEIEALFAKM
jgi:hypothetical protein